MDHLDLIKAEMHDTGELDSNDKLEMAAELVKLSKQILIDITTDVDSSHNILHALEIVHLLSSEVPVHDIEKHELEPQEPHEEPDGDEPEEGSNTYAVTPKLNTDTVTPFYKHRALGEEAVYFGVLEEAIDYAMTVDGDSFIVKVDDLSVARVIAD